MEDREVVVPETNLPLEGVEIENLQRLINPLRNSEYHGVDIYADVIAFFDEHVQQTLQGTV